MTRTREQSSSLALGLRVLGADVVEVPTIRIVPPASYALLDEALARVADYDTLLVTSANTARVVASRKSPPWESQPLTVAIGPATAEALLEAGLRVDLQPMPAIAEAVIAALTPTAKGKRMLLARAAVAREILPVALRAAGATVDIVPAYQTVLAEESTGILRDALASGERVDAVTFTSSSTVDNLLLLLGPAELATLRESVHACSIGPITSATLRSHGMEPATEALSHDVEGLIRAIEALLAQ